MRTARRPVQRLAEDELNQYALRALACRAHSTAELRQKLEKRAAAPADVERVLEHFVARGWLEDHRFALDYARYRATSRRYGRYRITSELRRKGVAEEWIEEALAEIFPGEKEERAVLRKRMAKRLRHQRPPYSQKLLRSLYASLLRAGFSSAIIRSELFRGTRAKFSEEIALEEEEA